MDKDTRLREVLAAVSQTPAKFLTYGKPVNTLGCVCAVGAWAYKKDRSFRGRVDKIRADPWQEGSAELASFVCSEAYSLFREQNFGLTQEVFVANDMAYKETQYESPQRRKLAILSSIADLLEEAA